ncbi:protein artemis-like isoform X3 [Temnothorax americanus]|uniref:protein artemis-like isoform X3 n=1 Tax=Temnothorax americanus TaxID=1964332 RepID=UPI00406820F1
MSTFLGLIEEIPGISVDHFDGENLKSSAYFLSHCHTDHMKGLNYAFFEHLRQHKKYLYCSPISKVFLETKYDNTETCVKDIAVKNKNYKKIEIEYKSVGDDEKTVLYVTFISAGHCPGSVMFLFEKMGKLILYTGDFRINPKDYEKLKPLHREDFNNSYPKKLAKMYLDTTFLDRDFAFFPTREDSINVMREVVKEWLDKSPRNVVVLECSATYGSEFIYKRLSEFLNLPIHVMDYVHESYRRIVGLDNHITNNPFATRIHACMGKLDVLNLNGLKCRTDILEKDILIVVPSVMKWRGKVTNVVGEWDCTRDRTFNVCYSTHASCHELEEFIRYFEPEDIYPCVCPEDAKYRVFHLLREIKNKIKKERGDAV